MSFFEASKILAVVRICVVREASKIAKADNKPITTFFGSLISESYCVRKSFSVSQLHPARLEPATL
jgi:hypothetical protein